MMMYVHVLLVKHIKLVKIEFVIRRSCYDDVHVHHTSMMYDVHAKYSVKY